MFWCTNLSECSCVRLGILCWIIVVHLVVILIGDVMRAPSSCHTSDITPQAWILGGILWSFYYLPYMYLIFFTLRYSFTFWRRVNFFFEDNWAGWIMYYLAYLNIQMNQVWFLSFTSLKKNKNLVIERNSLNKNYTYNLIISLSQSFIAVVPSLIGTRDQCWWEPRLWELDYENLMLIDLRWSWSSDGTSTGEWLQIQMKFCLLTCHSPAVVQPGPSQATNWCLFVAWGLRTPGQDGLSNVTDEICWQENNSSY